MSLDRFHLEKALRRVCLKHKAPGRYDANLHELTDQSELGTLVFQYGACSCETVMDAIHYLVENLRVLRLPTILKMPQRGAVPRVL